MPAEMGAATSFAIVALIIVGIIRIPLAIAEAVVDEQESKSKITDDLMRDLWDCIYEDKIKLSYDSLYAISDIYLPSLSQADYEYICKEYVEPLKYSLDFSYSFKTLKATNDFRNSETKALFNKFELKLINMYYKNKEAEELFDEELLKSYKNLT
jgi:hypothetical protein